MGGGEHSLSCSVLVSDCQLFSIPSSYSPSTTTSSTSLISGMTKWSSRTGYGREPLAGVTDDIHYLPSFTHAHTTHTHTLTHHTPHTAGVHHRVHDVWISNAVSEEGQKNQEDRQ